MDFGRVYEDGNSRPGVKVGNWEIDRLENRLYDFEKNFSGCTRLRKSEICPDGIGENLIGLGIVCTDSKWILSAYTRTEILSWSPGREFGN